MPHLPHIVTMLAAGIGIPVMAALNSQLGLRIGSPVAATTILFLVALSTALLTLALTSLGSGAPLAPYGKLAEQPKILILGGSLAAFYVLSITFVAPKFGVGNAVFFVLLGQLISSAMIDHFGLFGAQVKPLGLQRGAGIMVMALGVLLAVRA